MTAKEFKDAIESNPDFEYMGILGEEPDEEIAVRHKGSLTIAMKPESIAGNEWRHLEPVLAGKREPTVMIHLTRVVGYFSRVTNWSGSKKAELRDRHKGNYEVV